MNNDESKNVPKASLKPYIEERPWGKFERFTQNEISTVKIITIQPHQGLSLQYHHKRSEFWKVLSGEPIITIDDTAVTAHEGDEFFAPKGAHHRMQAGDHQATVLEVAFGEFDEGDIVRIEDRYGRA